MKLDKIKFARLIAYLSPKLKYQFDDTEIEHMDDIIDIAVPAADPVYPNNANIDDMLKSIADGRKIDAIKAYRHLTGRGLKESKDMIEAYWLRQPSCDVKAIMLQAITSIISGERQSFNLQDFETNKLEQVKAWIESF